MEYRDYVMSKVVTTPQVGIPKTMQSEISYFGIKNLKDWQMDIVRWALERGRSAIFADCGLGKTAIQLAWADKVAEHSGKPVLILAPLAVAVQTVKEAADFGIDCGIEIVRDGSEIGGAGIYITNYEVLKLLPANVICQYLFGKGTHPPLGLISTK